jgi:hypothetical protein
MYLVSVLSMDDEEDESNNIKISITMICNGISFHIFNKRKTRY